MKNVLFISHANPQDNDFVIWISSRLKLMGYDVWSDIENLIGGEKTWQEIDQMIRNNSVKYILVVSKSICTKPGVIKDGIYKEFSLAEEIAKKQTDDFIIPIKIDDAPYDYFIGLNRYNHISFEDNWATGFNQLIKKLEKDNVPKREKFEESALTEWYKHIHTTKYDIQEKKEKYYSNWWEIKNLPEYFYIYKYENELQAQAIRKQNRDYPLIKYGNCVVSFSEKINSGQKDSVLGDYTISPYNIYKINTSSILNKSYDSDEFPTLKDCENILKWLLNETFSKIMLDNYLTSHPLANGGKCYFVQSVLKTKEKISFSFKGKTKRKVLFGNYKISNEKDGFWHIAISAKTQLYPVVAFSLKTHILFSDDGLYIWPDKDKLHAARRKKGKRWFNQEWRDILLAFIKSLKNESGNIEIELSEKNTLQMLDTPYGVDADFDYAEPTSEDRQNILEEDNSEDESEGENKDAK